MLTVPHRVTQFAALSSLVLACSSEDSSATPPTTTPGTGGSVTTPSGSGGMTPGGTAGGGAMAATPSQGAGGSGAAPAVAEGGATVGAGGSNVGAGGSTVGAGGSAALTGGAAGTPPMGGSAGAPAMGGSSAGGNSNSAGAPATGGAGAAGTPNVAPGDGTISINDPAPGWASQGGGTTGGGTDLGAAKVVSTQADFAAALGSSGIILVEPGEYRLDPMVLTSNTTVIGTAPGVVVKGSAELKGVSNVIVRNLEIRGDACDVNDCDARRDCNDKFNWCRDGDDAVEISGSTNVWFDHVHVADGQDGNLDVVRASDWVTVSFGKFSYSEPDKPHAFSNLIGRNDTDTANVGKLHVSFINTWWGENVEERMPRGRFGTVHVMNSYYNSARTDYVWGPSYGMKLLTENNMLEVGGGTVINSGFDTPPKGDGSAAWRAEGNEGTGGGSLNGSKGTVEKPPYPYDLLPASAVKAKVTATACGAGNTCTLKR